MPPELCRRQFAWGCNPHGHEKRVAYGLATLTANSMCFLSLADASMHIDGRQGHISALHLRRFPCLPNHGPEAGARATVPHIWDDVEP
jgi:hypothetical protein